MYCWKRCFLLGPCKGVIRRTIEARIVQLEESRRSKRTGAREAEEYTLLEAVVRERLVKTQQAGKGLRGCCGNL
jgi:hypothetical protein